jgi:DNA-3-methyladenine glycosylase
MSELPTSFFARSALEVAPELLNKVLVAGPCRGRICEVEAYTADDPASHSFGGRTARNAAMFGPPGTWYVYLIYGMHLCLNVVTADHGVGEAVLLRGVIPLDGVDVMQRRRGRSGSRSLTDGPAKLCQAFAVERSLSGSSAIEGDVFIIDDGVAPPAVPTRTTRIGITKGTDRPWRYITASPDDIRQSTLSP